MLGHPTKNYYTIKDNIRMLIDTNVLFLGTEKKKATTNMVSLQLGQSKYQKGSWSTLRSVR